MSAVDQYWKGAGTDNLWSTIANWSTAVPTAGDAVIYQAVSTAKLSNYVAASTSIKGIIVSNLNANATPSGGILTASSNASAGVSLTIGAGGIDMALAVTNMTLNLPLVLGGPQTWSVGSSRSLTLGGVVSGANDITINGPGSVILGTGINNTFAGAVNVNSGTLTPRSATGLGAAANVVTVASGASLYFNGTNGYTAAEQLVLNGTGINGSGALRAGSAFTYTLSGNVTLGSSSQISVDGSAGFTFNGSLTPSTGANPNLDFENNGTVTVNGGILLGAGTLYKGGFNTTLTLANGTNSWSGGTQVGGGTLNIGSGGAGSIGTGNITFTNNGTLTFNSSTPITINDVIAGPVILNQNGTGVLTLNANNTYTSNTTIGASARLVLGPLAVIPNTFATTLTVNGVFDLSAQPAGYTLGGLQTLAGSGFVFGNISTSSGATITGTPTLYGNLDLASGAIVRPGGSPAVGTITVFGSLNLNSPTLYFDLANVATEGSGVNDEILVAGNYAPSGTVTIALNFLEGALAPGTYKLIRYGGAKTASATYVLDQNYPGLTIDDSSTPGLVLLNVSTALQRNLTWVGDGINNWWDVETTADWTNSLGVSQTFRQLDNVRFDDNGATVVNITTNVRPSQITFDTAYQTITLASPSLPGKITGPASIVKAGAPYTQAFIATTNNDYSGPTIVNAGTLTFQDIGNLSPAGGISVASGAVLEFAPAATTNNVASILQPDLIVANGGTLRMSGGGAFSTLALGNQGNNVYRINMRMASGATLEVTAGHVRNGGWQGAYWTDGLTWTNLGDLSVSGGDFDVWDGNPVYFDAINGTGGQVGCAFTGGTRNLFIGTDNGIGTYSGTVVANLATYNRSNNTFNLNKIGTGTQYLERFTRGNGGTGTPVANVYSGTLTLGGTVDNVAASANVYGGLLELAKTPSSSSVHALGSTLTVTNDGIAKITGTGGDQIYFGATVNIYGAGLLDLNSQSEGFNGFNGDGFVDSLEPTTSNLVLQIGMNNAGGTWAGAIKNTYGTVALTKVGTGTQIITGTNAHTGGTTVSLGSLQYGNSTYTGTTTASVSLTNSIPNGDVALANPTNAASAFLRFNLTTNAYLVYNGSITNGATNGVLVVAPGGGTLYVNSATNPAADNIGVGTLVLGGDNNFTGPVTVNAGTLVIKKSNSLGTGTKTVSLSNGTSGHPSLHLDGAGGDINLDSAITFNTSWWGDGVIVNDAGNNTIGGNINLTAGGGDSSLVVNGGTLTFNGLIAPNTTSRSLRLGGAGDGIIGSVFGGYVADGSTANTLVSLRKIDSGTWTLNNSNPYTGATAIEDGTLVLGANGAGGALPATSQIIIASNATFDVSAVAAIAPTGFWTNNGKPLVGSGTVVGNTALAANTLVQVGSNGYAGTLTFQHSLLMDIGVTNRFELSASKTEGAGVNDLVNVGGDLDPNNARIFVSSLASLSPGTYRLFNYAGAKPTSFNPTVLTDTRYTLTLDETVTNQINLVVSGGAGGLLWYGATSYSWDVDATANWDFGSSKFLQGDTVTFDDINLATNVVAITTTVVPGLITFNNSTTNYTVQGSGKISAGASIDKSGTGSVRINTANDFTGPVTISGGTLVTGNASALGATNGGTTISPGATLDVAGTSLGFEPITMSGAGVGGAGAVVNSGGGQNNALRRVTLAGDTTLGGTNRWDVRSSNTADPATGSLSTGGQPFNLTKVGPNQVSLVGLTIDPALADVTVKQGIFDYEYTSTCLGNPTNKLTVEYGAQLEFWNTTNELDKVIVLYGTGTNACFYNGSGSGTIVGPVTLNSNCNFNIGGTSLTLNTVVDGPGMLTKSGSARLTLTGTNTYSGGTFLAAGTLELGNGDVGGMIGPAFVLTNDGGILQFNRADDFTWNTHVIGTNGQFIKINANRVTLGESITNVYGGQGQVNAGTLVLSTNSFLFTGNQFWVAQAAAAGNTNIATCIINGGTLVVSNNWIAVGRNSSNAFGTLILNRGTIIKSGANNISVGSVGANGIVTVNGGAFYNNSSLYLGENATGTGLLNLNGGIMQCLNLSRQNAASLSSIANFDGGTLLAYTNHPNFITVDTANIKSGGLKLDDGGFAVTNTQPLLGDLVSTGGGLTKLGSGTLYFNSVGNTYTGPTLVNEGTLAGTGLINTPVTVNSGGALAPGNNFFMGALAVSNNLTFTAGSTAFMNVNAATLANSQLVGLNTLACAGTLAVNNLGGSFVNGNSFKLFSANTITGTFAAISPASPGSGLAWDTSALYSQGVLKVTAGTSIPSYKTNISYAVVAGNKLKLSWPPAYIGVMLQAQTNALNVGLVTNNAFWFNVTGSDATNEVYVPINTLNGTVFFRLIKP